MGLRKAHRWPQTFTSDMLMNHIRTCPKFYVYVYKNGVPGTVWMWVRTYCYGIKCQGMICLVIAFSSWFGFRGYCRHYSYYGEPYVLLIFSLFWQVFSLLIILWLIIGRDLNMIIVMPMNYNYYQRKVDVPNCLFVNFSMNFLM